ncbi:hypothetical protein D3C78_1390960 [compost metagenome]
MELDLIHHRLDLRIFHQVFQMMYLEIADTDRFDASCLVQLFKRTPSVLVLACHRPVNQIQVEIIQPQLLQAGLIGGKRRFITEVAVPHLGSDKQVLT